jgi:hypothetical protein
MDKHRVNGFQKSNIILNEEIRTANEKINRDPTLLSRWVNQSTNVNILNNEHLMCYVFSTSLLTADHQRQVNKVIVKECATHLEGDFQVQ